VLQHALAQDVLRHGRVVAGHDRLPFQPYADGTVDRGAAITQLARADDGASTLFGLQQAGDDAHLPLVNPDGACLQVDGRREVPRPCLAGDWVANGREGAGCGEYRVAGGRAVGGASLVLLVGSGPRNPLGTGGKALKDSFYFLHQPLAQNGAHHGPCDRDERSSSPQFKADTIVRRAGRRCRPTRRYVVCQISTSIQYFEGLKR